MKQFPAEGDLVRVTGEPDSAEPGRVLFRFRRHRGTPWYVVLWPDGAEDHYERNELVLVDG